jgi:spore coat polysaccharide biosynthesis predicted glycosyltransferase SpsG
MRVPMLALSIDESQRAVARWAEQAGFGIDLGGSDVGRVRTLVTELLADPARRAAMGEAGRSAVDGRGADRVAELLLDAAVSSRRRGSV